MDTPVRSRFGLLSGRAEDDLIRQIKSGGPPEALGELWERHQGRVWGWVNAWAWHASLQAADAEDAREEAFLGWHDAVLECNPAVALAGKLLVFLRPVLRHDFLDFLRRLWSEADGGRGRKAGRAVPRPASIEPVDYGSDPAAVLEWGQQLQAVWDAVQALPEPLRDVAERRALGESLSDIAEDTGRASGQVKWLWEQARAQLRADLHGLRDWHPTSPRPSSLRSQLLCDAADSVARLIVYPVVGLATMTYP
jgi:RNA polymerase sigma factor (sigma-70 family)